MLHATRDDAQLVWFGVGFVTRGVSARTADDLDWSGLDDRGVRFRRNAKISLCSGL